jgi:hypothetical protein
MTSAVTGPLSTVSTCWGKNQPAKAASNSATKMPARILTGHRFHERCLRDFRVLVFQ